MKGQLILENGKRFYGNLFGKIKDSVGEVVFNTGMTGYQEILTDPSYYGQMVIMTYPLIGNYGANLEDFESSKSHVKGLIVSEFSKNPSNFRCEMDLDSYLKLNEVVGIEGIDTRALTKVIRNEKVMNGILTNKKLSDEEIKKIFLSFKIKDAVKNVTTNKVVHIDGEKKHVAILDFGIKNNILRHLKSRGCKLDIFPSNSKAEDILSVNPDLIFLSNGPGDPEDLLEEIEEIKKLALKKPIAGICLGHQLLALAFGGKTKKMKFGHRGCNHPVKDLYKDKIFITSQNHGYVVDELPKDMQVTHINLNDNTIAGMKHKNLNIKSVQFHPEASPGPVETDYLFDEFLEL